MSGSRRLTPAKLVLITLVLVGLGWYAFQVLRPALPVTVQLRSDTREPGFVLIFKNDSDQPLSLNATLSHAGQTPGRQFELQVLPHGVYELGAAQGWTGRSGDRISLTSANYKAWTGGIP